MAGVSYGGQALIPGPFLTVQKQVVRSEDGGVRRKTFAVTLRGKLVADKGSPNAEGVFWTASGYPPDEVVLEDSRLDAILTKQAAVEALFSTSGQALLVQPYDGGPAFKCYPRVLSVDFPEGKWATTADFVVSMEANDVWWGGTAGDASGLAEVGPEESWAVELQDPNLRTYRVTHAASSQQKETRDENGDVTAEGWENAKSVVEPSLGNPLPAGMTPPQLSGYVSCNYTRSQAIDEAAGRYSVTENYVYLYAAPVTEEFVVQARYQEGVTHVSVDGTITGYSPADPTLTPLQFQAARYAQALAAWDLVLPELLVRAQNYSATLLHPVSLNNSVGLNPVTGVVSYQFEFDNRPPGIVPGSLSESYTVSQQNPADVFAALVVLGRAAGPVLQDIGTVTAKFRTVNVEVVMPPWVYGEGVVPPASPDVQAVLDLYFPGGLVARDEESWLPQRGRYARNVTWTYE